MGSGRPPVQRRRLLLSRRVSGRTDPTSSKSSALAPAPELFPLGLRLGRPCLGRPPPAGSRGRGFDGALPGARRAGAWNPRSPSGSALLRDRHRNPPRRATGPTTQETRRAARGCGGSSCSTPGSSWCWRRVRVAAYRGRAPPSRAAQSRGPASVPLPAASLGGAPPLRVPARAGGGDVQTRLDGPCRRAAASPGGPQGEVGGEGRGQERPEE